MTWASAAELRELLAEAGFAPSRYRGQCFLVDRRLAEAIVRDAELAADEGALEVGAGCGVLTDLLAVEGRRVLAVEIEARLVELGRRRLGDRPGLDWLCADALAGKRRLNPVLEARLPGLAPYALVANLPYAVAGPVLVETASAPSPPARAVVTVQEETADRIAAAVGSSSYGPLTAALRLVYRVERLRAVPPDVFWPRPRVRSAVVRLFRRSEAPPRDSYRLYLDGVRRLFSWPRKALRTVLRNLGVPEPDAVLERAGVRPEARAETLAPEALLRLSEELPVGRS